MYVQAYYTTHYINHHQYPVREWLDWTMPSAHTFQQRQKSPYIGLGLLSINHSLNSKELRVIYTTRNNPVRLHEPPLSEITCIRCSAFIQTRLHPWLRSMGYTASCMVLCMMTILSYQLLQQTCLTGYLMLRCSCDHSLPNTEEKECNSTKLASYVSLSKGLQSSFLALLIHLVLRPCAW